MPEAKIVMQSNKFTLNSEDVGKVFKGLLFAMIGAGLTYVTNNLPNVDLGDWTPAAVAVWATVSNLIYRFINGPAPAASEDN